MKALVTGCAGFVGSHLVERLLADGHEVVGLDAFTDYYDPAEKRANLAAPLRNPSFRLVEADLATADVSPLLAHADAVWHLAATPGVRGSWGREFDTYVRNNVLATQRLLEAAKGSSLARFVYASSSSVYGAAAAPGEAIAESALTRPHSPYGMTKLAAEHLVLLYQANHGVPGVSCRLFTVYGPRQRPDMAFRKFIAAALAGEALPVFAGGAYARDFTYVSDTVEGLLAAASRPVAGSVLNLGSGRATTVSQAIDLVEKLVGRAVERRDQPAPKGDVPATLADISMARRILGYAPRVNLAEGLAREVEWVRSSPRRAGSR